MKRLKLVLVCCLLFLWFPLAIIAWKGLSLEAFSRLRDRPEVMASLRASVFLALGSAFISTLLGTLTAFALPGLPNWAKRLTGAGLVFPMMLPEIAFGLALMTWFIRLGFPFGWGTLTAAHVAFSFSYATIVMKTRVEVVDKALIDAARDLGASTWHVFHHGLWPQIAPGLGAAFITAFSLSLDDFLISFFVKGLDQVTLPIRIYGMMKVRIGPEIYALSVLLFCISVLAVLLSQAWLAKESSRRSQPS